MVYSPALPLRLGEDSEAAGLCKEPRAATRFQGRGKEGQARGRVRSGFHHLGVGAPGSLAPGPCTFLPGAGWDAGRNLGGLQGEADCPAAASHTGGPGIVQHHPARGVRAGEQQPPQVTEGGSPGRSSPAASPEWAADLELGWGVGRAQGGDPERHLPLGPANCSTCSAPQVTFHRADGTRLCQAGTAPWPCPHREGVLFKCPCRGFCQAQGLLGRAGQKEEAGEVTWSRRHRKIDASG